MIQGVFFNVHAVFDLIISFILEISFNATPHFVPEIIRNKFEVVLVWETSNRGCKMKSKKALKIPILPFRIDFLAILPIGKADGKGLFAA